MMTITGWRVSRRVALLALAAVVMLVAQQPAHAYLKFGTTAGGRSVTVRWNDTPVRYFVSDAAGVPGVSVSQFQAAIGRAFTTWENVPTASITFQSVGFTGALPFEDDGMSTLGFLNKPELERVLATTNFLIDTRTGAIVESDIFFNSNFPWSVAAAGEAGRFDVESIAVHEIGHMIGLGHSAIGETEVRPTGGRRVIAAESVMFPIAFAAGNIADRGLKADDVAGVSDVYPTDDFNANTGGIGGRVTRSGRGIFGAHVVAFNPATGALVGGFSFTDGGFSIGGLSPGPHILRVEPLDDGDIESFFDPGTSVELDFRVKYYERLVVVPAGGDAPRVEVNVVPK